MLTSPDKKRTNLRLLCSPAHVKEVGGGAAMELDDVHGGHGQPCPVDHAADAAVQPYVVQVVLACCHFPAKLARGVSSAESSACCS